MVIKDIINGLYATFSMDDVKHVKPRQPACRECEILGAAAAFTGAAYTNHLRKCGRVMPYPGMFYSIVLATLGFSLLLTFPPDGEITQVLQKMKEDRLLKEEEARKAKETE